MAGHVDAITIYFHARRLELPLPDVSAECAMDNREAKEILALYRPGDTHTPDAEMAEALAQAQRDPHLAEWFRRHCATIAKNPAAATHVQPKPASPAVGDHDRIIPMSNWALVMIFIAVIVVIAGVLWAKFSPRPQNTFEAYRDRMARLVQRSYPMIITATDQAQIREYFRTNTGPGDFEVPKSLEKLPGKGAAVFTWHGEPVALMGLDAGGNTNLYLFVMKRNVFPNTQFSARPKFDHVGAVTAASWSRNDYLYLLTGPDENALQNYLELP